MVEYEERDDPEPVFLPPPSKEDPRKELTLVELFPPGSPVFHLGYPDETDIQIRVVGTLSFRRRSRRRPR